jgi:toxin YoeB
MGKYIILYSKQAFSDLEKIKKSGKKLDMEKIQSFLIQIEETPRIGIGNPEQMKHYEGEIWSRKINKKDRFVYEIFEEEQSITIIQSLGHYRDK